MLILSRNSSLNCRTQSGLGSIGLTSYTSRPRAKHRYCGKEKDKESGLYYYGARYYESWTCRFVSVDPLAEKFAQLSSYNYADNSPVTDLDLDGLQGTDTGSTEQGGANPTYTGKAIDKTDNNHWKIRDVHNMTEKEMKASNLSPSTPEIEVNKSPFTATEPLATDKTRVAGVIDLLIINPATYDQEVGYRMRNENGGSGGDFNLPSARHTELLMNLDALVGVWGQGAHWFGDLISRIIGILNEAKVIDYINEKAEKANKVIDTTTTAPVVVSPRIETLYPDTGNPTAISIKPIPHFSVYSIPTGKDSSINMLIQNNDTTVWSMGKTGHLSNRSRRASSKEKELFKKQFPKQLSR